MGKARDYMPSLYENKKILPSDILGGGGLGIGNVYYVIQTTEAFYSAFFEEHNVTYEDGSESVCPYTSTVSAVTTNGIKNALAKTVEDRNDYVVIMPGNSTYYTDEALVINKKSVHLICPAGFGNATGSTNAARIQQITAATAIIAVSDASVEIAGIFFRPIADTASITLAATSYSPNIHHNFFGMSWSTGTIAAQITCSGDGGGWGTIEYNHFTSYAGNARTAAIAAISIDASATGARCNHNTVVIGDTNIATVAISNQAVKGMTCFNYFSESGGSGVATNGGTITNCISIGVSGCAIGNLGAVATGHLATGGTAAVGFCENYDGVDNVAASGSVQA